MNIQEIINFLLGTGLSLMSWFARELWVELKSLKSDISELQKDLPRKYVDQEHYREDVRELKSMMDKIFDRMNAKFEKLNLE